MNFSEMKKNSPKVYLRRLRETQRKNLKIFNGNLHLKQYSLFSVQKIGILKAFSILSKCFAIFCQFSVKFSSSSLMHSYHTSTLMSSPSKYTQRLDLDEMYLLTFSLKTCINWFYMKLLAQMGWVTYELDEGLSVFRRKLCWTELFGMISSQKISLRLFPVTYIQTLRVNSSVIR